VQPRERAEVPAVLPPEPAGAMTRSLVEDVLARLPSADHERARARRQQLTERLAAIAVVTLLLIACVGPQASNLATRTFAWLLAAAETWKVLVSVALGGLMLVPVISSICMVTVSVLLWQRLIRFEQRGLR
jgi:hypothetical protein